MLDRITQQMFCQVDAAFLSVFRIGFGAILLFESVNYGLFLCIDCFYHSSDLLFKYRHFDWVSAAPTMWLRAIWLLMAVLAAMVVFGFYYRFALLLYTVGFTYHFLLDQVLYLNHFYLVILFCVLMTLMPAHVYWSVDAKRSSAIASNTVPYWTKFLLAAQLEIVLIYAGLVKLNADWLSLEPMRMWMIRRSHDEIALFQWLTQDWGIALASYGVIALHLIGAPLLLFRKTRLPVLFGYALFHTINMFVFNIGIFPWFTLFASLLFFDPDWPRQFAAWLIQKRWISGKSFDWSTRIARSDSSLSSENHLTTSLYKQRLILALVVLWLALQAGVPWRHLFLPGNVAWNESGHRFSWRMKLRSKNGTALFIVETPDGQRLNVEPSDHLNVKQVRKMTCIPDLLWQFAQFLETQHTGDVKVFVQTHCSLNGRPHTTLINPDVDLTAIDRAEPVDRWVLPLTVPLKSTL